MRVLLAVVFGACVVHAAEAETLKLRHGQAYSSAHSIFSLPVAVADQEGFFAREGLKVDIIVPIPGGSDKMIAALHDEWVDLTHVATPFLIRAALAGSDAVAIAAEFKNPIYSLIANSSINSFAELKGKVLGLADEVIGNKPDAIVLAPFDPSAMVPAVDKLNAAGIPVVNVNERLSGGNTVAYVGTDDYQLALTTARYLINAMEQRGNVMILEGPETLLTSVARVKAYKDALREFPAVKLLASKSANYARAAAAQEMKSLLRLYPQIDGVLAANDPMAIGAAEALRAANRKALVVGINASREVIEFVKSGDVLGSGDYNGFDQGCLATEIAIRNLRKQPTPKEIILKATVMDKRNYQDYETPMEQRRCPTVDSVAGH